MGVRGLSSFFNQNPELLNEYQLHNTTVVIDGNNLVHVLYFSYGVDCTYGGDYDKFANVVRKYFRSFLECNIKPIVIFDGAYDITEKKMATVLHRTKQRLTYVQHIAKHGTCAGKVLPILAIEVMKSVMKCMKIVYVQCDYEADEHITAVANHYCCPVISQDSDFYIYNIKNGYIRSDSLSITICEKSVNEEKSLKFLSCKIFYIDRFLAHFPGIDKTVLPLFATLMGNDYVDISIFDNFFANIQLPKFKPKLKVNQRHRKMIGLLAWLKYISLQDAVEQVLKYMKAVKREQMRELIKKTVHGYAADSSQLIDYIDAFNSTEFSKNCFESTLVTFSGKNLPIWFIEKFRIGDFSPFLVNALGLRKAFLISQIEEPTYGSSYDCSLHIRQAIYNILISYESDSSEFTGKYFTVEEYDRNSNNIHKKHIEINSPDEKSLPTFDSLDKPCIENSRACIVNVLGEKLEYFLSLPPELQLLIGSVRFWLKNCKHKPEKEFLYGMIMNFIIGGKSNLISDHSENNSSVKCDILSALGNVKTEHELFASRMKKYFQKPHHNNAHRFNVKTIHAFSQLQTCLLYTLYLNVLLGKPFVQTRIEECFCGTFIYNLTRDFLTRSCPRNFVSELMGRNSHLNDIFSYFERLILEGISDDCFSSGEKYNKRNQRKRNKKNRKEKERKSETNNEEREDQEEMTSCYNRYSTNENIEVLL